MTDQATMHKLTLQPVAKEIETERLQAVAKAEPITVTVPLIDLFARSYCYFYQSHGCTAVDLSNNLYRFTFPLGTLV